MVGYRKNPDSWFDFPDGGAKESSAVKSNDAFCTTYNIEKNDPATSWTHASAKEVSTDRGVFGLVPPSLLVKAVVRVRHSRTHLSLDLPRDGEVLEPSGIQAKLDGRPPTHSTCLRVVVSMVEPRLKHSGVTNSGHVIVV